MSQRARTLHGHVHAQPGQPGASPRTRWIIAALLIPLGVATLLGLLLLWPGTDRGPRTGLGLDQELARGELVRVAEAPCAAGPAGGRCLTATVQVTDGPGAGQHIEVPAPEGAGAPVLRPGDGLVLTYAPNAPAGLRYQITDFQRGSPLLVLAALFALVVVAFGRWRGVAALAGLGVSFGVLLLFVLPAILAGSSPLLVAVTGAATIMLAVLYLTHGVNVWTSVAVLGTLGALALTGALGAVFTVVARFTGLAGEEAGLVGTLYSQVDPKGLLLAGIVIGSIGVLDDVTVTQSATVAELARANPGLGRLDLYRAAGRVGREHVASTVNTLVLAYAGASLPLLLLFSASGRGVGDLLTNEFVAQEVVRSAVGSIGIVAAVPLTTWLAVLLLPDSGTAPPPRRGRRRRA